MLASVNGFAEICSILLISGADVSIKEKVCAPEFLNMLPNLRLAGYLSRLVTKLRLL